MDSPLPGLGKNAVERMRRAVEISREVARRFNGALASKEFSNEVLKRLQEEDSEAGKG